MKVTQQEYENWVSYIKKEGVVVYHVGPHELWIRKATPDHAAEIQRLLTNLVKKPKKWTRRKGNK